VIGGLLIDPQALYRIAEPLRPSDFADGRNARAYRVICRMLGAGETVDVVTVSEAGGGELAYLGRLAKDTPSAANVPAYAERVREAARRRTLARALQDGLARIERGEPVAEVQQAVGNALDATCDSRGRSFSEIVGVALTQAETAREQRLSGSTLGVSWTLPLLNHLTGGLHGPKLVVLGGRPGTFKTAFALQVAARAAAQGRPVGFVSLEMAGPELAMRAIANELRLNGADLAHGDRETLKAAQQAQGWDWPLFIEDRVSSWPDIAARVTGWKHRHGIELAVIDYLQIIRLHGKATRFEKLGEVSRESKLLAQRLGIPILLLAQISRAVEQDKRRPLLSDIRECGNVEQDADLVLFTHRRQCDDRPDEFELILAKQRNGPAGKVIRLHVDGPAYRIGEVWEQGA
ncbi:MAG TPA: replicative DNA helicase, partial [Gammaproteobacteria bacterium]|nr:replicative DNA helicase [Gammaproteobacteria bacterium]